jgi:hypothetical protein
MTNHATADARLERIKKLGQLLPDSAAKLLDPRPRRTIA